MWAIFKIKTKKNQFFINNINKIFGKNILFYEPQYKKIVFSKNKYVKKIKKLLPDHIFVYSDNFEKKNLNCLKHIQ